MNIRYVIKTLFYNPKKFIESFIQYSSLSHFISDKMAIKILYKIRFGKNINLKNPQTFNEKLLWLTLYDRRPEYNRMVDKYEAKEWIRNKMGDGNNQMIIPTYGIYDSFDNIDFSKLPKSFVMKTTHDSGGVIVVSNKDELDMMYARKKMEKSMRRNYFWFSREWAYRDIVPRIIIEKKLETKENSPIDYKIFCFDGKAKYLYLVQDRDIKETVDYYDMEWNHLPIKQVYNNNTKQAVKPNCWKEMVETAEILSKGFPFLRVDFYVDKYNQYYIGELTLTPSSGLLPITPIEWDYEIGKQIVLPEKCK